MNSPIWMPYTQMKEAPTPLMVRSGRGAMLELEDGRQVMDCISSWWVTLHGHAQPEIAAAIAAQAGQLEQVIAAGFTHQPAEELARRLTGRLPFLPRLFYSDNGSTAVEVGLKVAFQYWRNQGAAGRRRFLSLEGAYHGDTLGAMSLSGRSLFTEAFAEMLLPVDFVPFPQAWLGDEGVEEREARALEHLEGLLRRSGEEYAAMILEPLVQGAAGMRMCRPSFLQAAEVLLRRHGVLVIYDEVLTGFGRTGEFFACQKAETRPDILCLAKGLSGGFLPLAATLCAEELYQAFCSGDPRHTLYHGHSYTANPLGCAAALASLELLEKEDYRFREMEDWHREELAELADHPHLRRLRVCGTIAALEVEGAAGYLHELGPRLRQRFLERGFLLRPLGGVIYLVPPYCLERAQLGAVYRCIGEVVSAEVSS
ncbi:MAG: adenosylmethionine--8-amino-7-oxononanoate transaminase [Candidatus Latescibacteria bacterium]|nr:adenosylmethionine--8-amino-7-oxononanoate transaminase [Candidatus Latescibacterota bacterium]